MSFLNKLPFGKNKAKAGTNKQNSGHDDGQEDMAQGAGSDVVGESELVGESQLIAESEAQNTFDKSTNDRSESDPELGGSPESVMGSSASMSVESIVATAEGVGMGDLYLPDDALSAAPRAGFGSRFKGLFGGRKPAQHVARAHQESSEDLSADFDDVLDQPTPRRSAAKDSPHESAPDGAAGRRTDDQRGRKNDRDLPADSAGEVDESIGLQSLFETKDDSIAPAALDTRYATTLDADDDGEVSELAESITSYNRNTREAEALFADDETIADRRMAEIIAEIGPRPNAVPIIGKLPRKQQYTAALSILAVSLLSAGVLSITGLTGQGFYKERANIGTRLQLAVQNSLLTTQNLVIRADEGSFAQLQEDKAVLEQVRVLFATETSNAKVLEATNLINESILPILQRVLSIGGELGSINVQTNSLEKGAGELYLLADQLASYLQSNSSSAMHIAAANDIRVRAERMSRNGAKMLTSNTVSLEPIAQFSSDLRELSGTMAVLTDGVPGIALAPLNDTTAKDILKDIRASTMSLNNVAVFLQRNANALVKARLDVSLLRASVQKTEAAANVYTAEVSSAAEGLQIRILIALVFLAVGVGALGVLGLISNRLTRIEAWETAYKNKANERDIIDFMKEILPLEMGDLTVGFTGNTAAMEGVTGGIRSSVNEAVTSLRDAMYTVKHTAGSVMSNVSDSVDSSRDLQDSNNRQSKEIEDVVDRVANLTSAIEQVTDNTVRAADMTSSALVASEAGAHVVAQTNKKMAEIRSSMQDVLKSVKHLGETSHEIGTIVEAIETITDRTQVIAVNASLEASKAGSAGQGFMVLAGEVNRLAEQSNDSLRTITALVQRIQGETASTIRAVEDSTSNVVEGARLSELANSELTKISALSNQLQEIMTEIRTQSEQQSGNAGSVKLSMDRLDDLSKQFQTSVTRMVAGVQQIDASMGTLQNTVSIFTTEQEAA